MNQERVRAQALYTGIQQALTNIARASGVKKALELYQSHRDDGFLPADFPPWSDALDLEQGKVTLEGLNVINREAVQLLLSIDQPLIVEKE